MLDADDQFHRSAQTAWATLLEQEEPLITTNYVVVEASALLARRAGFRHVRVFSTDIVPVLGVHWVDEALHDRAVAALLGAGQRNLSLVDCVSFEIMRQLGLDTAFAFDADFVQQGFRCIP